MQVRWKWGRESPPLESRSSEMPFESYDLQSKFISFPLLTQYVFKHGWRARFVCFCVSLIGLFQVGSTGGSANESPLPRKMCGPFFCCLYCHVLVTRHGVWIDNWIY
jgi:hypothetical protein